ncbi:MAG: AAA family ATPase [Rhodobacterales bacterium CG15_BIG_FIL_POST_REV_8_21_14_020_59_13]|nr:MAG: AAA family ATPase [Rhodobacterales bacterium CG15_BIG_FIL_POST_REV_8_21_14_020_59_13]
MVVTIPRWQKPRIDLRMKTRRVLLLAGPRQCGKTTLARSLPDGNTEYRTLDDPGLLSFALADPKSFVQHDKQMLIIDEVQRAPDLLLAIKQAVDVDTRPGQYLLTGSANLAAIPSVRESLAGRIAKIRLRPFAQGELAGAQPAFLDRAFDGNVSTPKMVTNRDQLISLGIRGNYPEVITLDNDERRDWHRDYLTAILERDLADITNIQRSDAMRQLVKVCAAWSSKLINIADITSKLPIKRPTVESYLNALEALYLVDRIPAWTQTDYGKAGKQPKLFMPDSGLMASVLDWSAPQVRLDADRSGKLMETLVYAELAAIADAAGGYTIYHYRDRNHREIDFLVEREKDGALLGIEVKASATAHKDDAKHLEWFRDNIAGDRQFRGLVVYSGEHAFRLGDRISAAPISAMWE